MSNNKFTTYLLYAVGEIILVVIGILIAVRINDANTHRKNKVREAEYLVNLHQEFVANLRQLEQVTEKNSKMFRSTNWAIENWPNYEQIPFDTLAFHFAELAGTPTFNPSQSVTRSLITTGAFELLSNDSLKAELLRFPDLYQDYHDEELDSKNAFHNELVPYMLKNLDMSSFSAQNPTKELDYTGVKKLEYKNILLSRLIGLSFIIKENELPALQECMERIISLSASTEQ